MIPEWLRAIGDRPAERLRWFADHPVPTRPHRSSAVLVLFGEAQDGEVSLVLTERAHDLRSHAAQVVFPGGHVDPGECATDAALREGWEEVGTEPSTIEVLAALPGVYLTPQRTELVPVIAWWNQPHPIGVRDPAEVRRVVQPPVAELADPANRFTATAPMGYRGPGFVVDDLVVWGLTAHLLDAVLELTGQVRPWDESRTRDVPEHLLAPYFR